MKTEITNVLELKDFLEKADNIDRACTSVIENQLSIFLPHKRIDNTSVYKSFIKNKQRLEIDNDLFDKVTLSGRLLGQSHKDILETLLSEELIFSKNNKNFYIETTAYKLLKNMGKPTGNKKWIIDKIKEIAECHISIEFKNADGKNSEFYFSFIDSILISKEDHRIKIIFTQSYTYFLANNELLDYRQYVPFIVSMKNEFSKAIVRYMLIHNSKKTKLKLSTILDRLRYLNIISQRELKKELKEFKSVENLEYIKKFFGIHYDTVHDILYFDNIEELPKRYFINKKKDL